MRLVDKRENGNQVRARELDKGDGFVSNGQICIMSDEYDATDAQHLVALNTDGVLVRVYENALVTRVKLTVVVR